MVQVAVEQTTHTSHGLRRAMVDNQVRTFDVTDQRVLDAFYTVPRESFLPDDLKVLAYSDALITLKSSEPGADDRVLMPPMFLARLLQGANVDPAERVLVVASASGYAAALVSRLAAGVVALDSDRAFSAMASGQAGLWGTAAVEIVTGPLAAGHPAGAPYGLILVNGAVECNLDALFAQLAPGGRLVAIECRTDQATRRTGKATRFDKVGKEISTRPLFEASLPVLQAFRLAPRFEF